MSKGVYPREPRNSRNARARKLFREYGFDVESVSFIRGHFEEFMAIKCWPSTDVAEVVEFFTRPSKHDPVIITRVHIGRETYPGSGKYHPRVYVAWNEVPKPPMSWDEINKMTAILAGVEL
jgi:hypothetical protein